MFAGFSRGVHDLGAFGNASRMKYVANLLVAIHNVATAEAMVLGMKAGLDPKAIFETIKTGAGNSRVFELRGPMMATERYDDATMKMKVWQKDMDVIGDFAKAIGCPTPLFTATEGIYRQGPEIRIRHAGHCRSLCGDGKMAGVKRRKRGVISPLHQSSMAGLVPAISVLQDRRPQVDARDRPRAWRGSRRA